MKTSVLRTAIASSLLLVATVAVADSPHYIYGPSATLNANDSVTLRWKEAGLGNASGTLSYTAHALVTGSYQCVNKGNNCPQAANKQDDSQETFVSGNFPIRHGAVVGALTFAGVPATTLDCPGGQREQLYALSYSEIYLASPVSGVADAEPSSFTIPIVSECP